MYPGCGVGAVRRGHGAPAARSGPRGGAGCVLLHGFGPAGVLGSGDGGDGVGEAVAAGEGVDVGGVEEGLLPQRLGPAL
jgi:hypothetical protein